VERNKCRLGEALTGAGLGIRLFFDERPARDPEEGFSRILVGPTTRMKAALSILLAVVGLLNGCAAVGEEERARRMEVQRRDNPGAYEEELQRRGRERSGDGSWRAWF
jgi:hypothetical protein